MNLYQGDCLEIMKSIPDASIDMILADPPYGITACKWDSIIPIKPMWEQIERIIKLNKAIVMTTSQPFTAILITSNIKIFKHEIIWFKNTPTGMAQASYAPMKYHENILVFCKGKINIFNKQMQKREGKGKACYKYEHYCGESNHVKMNAVKKYYNETLVNPSSVILFNTVPNRTNKAHPTQKPVTLGQYLIKTYTNPNETVLDFCMGSGSFGVAAIKENRDFIGIEKDEKYYKIAKKRILDL